MPQSTAARHPALAGNDELGNRFYTWRDERFWSVTTILNGGVPKYLHRWAARCVAELVIEELSLRAPQSRARSALRTWAKAGRLYVADQKALGELTSIDPAKLNDLDFIARYLKGAPDRIRDAHAVRGSDVHAKAEDIVLAEAREATRLVLDGTDLPTYPETIRPWMVSFVGWVNDWRPVFVAAEATVFNRPQGYAGTLDTIVELAKAELLARLEKPPAWLDVDALPDPVTAMVDYKAGNDVYREVAMQLSAYRAAEFVGSPDRVTELAMPKVDVGAVLHLTPKGARFRLVRVDDVVLRSFLYAREVYRWAIEVSRDVLGPVLAIPEKAVA